MFEDFDSEEISKYLGLRAQRTSDVSRFHNQAEALLGLDCAVRQNDGQIVPTNAGILFFGRYPQLSIPQSEVVCVAYRDEYGVGGYSDRKIISGTLVQIIDGIEVFLRNNIRIGGVLLILSGKISPNIP